MMHDLNMPQGKMSDFVSFPLFCFNVVIKLINFDFESHSNTLMFFDKKDIAPDSNISYGKISDFVSVPFFNFILVIKLINFDFESH